jgi:integrase
MRNGLSRFLRFCSALELQPEQVDDQAVEKFLAYLREVVPQRKIKDGHRRTTRLWNEASVSVSGWPQVRLTVPDNRPARRRLSLETLPEDFRRDLEAYLTMRANPDPFDETVPAKPLKPRTLQLRREQLRLAASALVECGRDPGSITRLADLVEPDAFKQILRQMRADHDNQPSAWVEGVAKTLVAVAQEWVHVPDDRLVELKRLLARLPKVQPGLTRKNREALRQFDDEVNLARLLELPGLLFQEACGIDPPTHKAGVKAQLALAIELLLNCPIRGQNLISLQLDQHILRPAGRRGKVYLCLEPSEVKNEEHIDFEFPAHLTRMLDTYLERFHPLLGGEHCSYLFATRDGKQKSQATLAQQISATIYKRTGLRMSPHQFRHLGANLHLEGNPGGFESLRQLLGHKSTKTTVNAYAGLNTRRAARLHDEMLARRREALAGKVRFRDRRRRNAGR